MDWWTVGWIIWGVAFFALEIPAALNKRKDDTLSEHIWSALTRPGNWYTWPMRIVLLLFLGWLAAHLGWHLFWL